jgi:helicase
MTAFHGLFIGVDRYVSPLINELGGAVRDAEALHALFADNLGADNAALLTDDLVTRQALIAQFKDRLARVAPEDFVVITYAGHGSDDFFLLPHDADPDDLPSTALALDELVDLFREVPAKNVLLVLDCCFSGGAGARVFHHSPTTRSLQSAEEKLLRIANDGRVILTAADSSQEAIEDPVSGHGVLTGYLLEALRGPPEIVDGNNISMFRLLQFVVERVSSRAKDFAHEQRACVRGSFNGDVTLPVLVPGALFASRFPEHAHQPVGEDVRDLVACGVPEYLVEALAVQIPTLNELQRDAINKCGILRGRHVVVVAPTSSGKTLVGEIAALRAVEMRKRTLVLLPLRALVNDKYRELIDRYGALGLRVVRATGEISDEVPRLLSGRYNIALMTYETAAAVMIRHPHVLRSAGVIVVDEAQMLADQGRGANLELALTLIKSRRRFGVEPQLILLSAVIGETRGLEQWLTAGLLRSDARPVPLREGILTSTGQFRFKGADGAEGREPVVSVYGVSRAKDLLVPTIRKLLDGGESVIIFRDTKGATRGVARYLAEELGRAPASNALGALPDGDQSASSQLLRETLRHGVAFHNANLDREERLVIENAFRGGKELRVLVATTTLAMGVNTPASTVLIVGLTHPGDTPYSVAEYKNMVGRAGRLGFSTDGKAMIVCTSPLEEHEAWSHYVSRDPEPLASRFLDEDPLLLVLRVLAIAEASKLPALTEGDVLDFIQNSFGMHQHRARAILGRSPSEESVRAAITRLADAGLVDLVDGSVRLTELGRVAGELGAKVETVVRAAHLVRQCGAAILSAAAVVATVQTFVELDEQWIPANSKSVKEKARWLGEVRGAALPLALQSSLANIEASLQRCKRFVAAMRWLDGVEMDAIERELMQHHREEDAAGAIRSVAERTRDFVPVLGRVVQALGIADLENSSLFDDIRIRLELGLPQGAVALARLVGNRITRADYLRVLRARMADEQAIAACDDQRLAVVLGDAAKASILRSALATPQER